MHGDRELLEDPTGDPLFSKLPLDLEDRLHLQLWEGIENLLSICMANQENRKEYLDAFCSVQVLHSHDRHFAWLTGELGL